MEDPGKIYLNNKIFSSDSEYLESLFVLADLLVFPDSAGRMKARGLSADQDPAVWSLMIMDRIRLTREAGISLAVEQVLEKTQAPYIMRMFLAFLMQSALDPGYEKAAAVQHGKESLVLYDLCGFFGAQPDVRNEGNRFRVLGECRDSLKLLFPQLFRRELLQGQSIAGLMPVMDARLLEILMGRGAQAELPAGMEYCPSESGTEPEEDPGALLLMERQRKMPPETVVLWAPEGSGKRDLVRKTAKGMKRDLAFFDLSICGDMEENAYSRTEFQLQLLLRECVLFDRTAVLEHMEKITEEQQIRIVRFLQEQFTDRTGDVFLLADTEEEPDHLPDCFFYHIEAPKVSDRIAIWRKLLSDDAQITQEGIESLANTFSLTPGQIRSAAEQIRRVSGPGGKISEDLIYRVCYAKLGHPLKDHTVRVTSPFVWDDLKMDPADKVVLKDLCRCVRSRHVVMQDWNFESKFPYGSGITALFAGPPGTGKTMAAQVIANELHMELYKIDLSQLIDKYVGETEKNIKNVFDRAAKSNCVLFFDEADAIFNKRLEANNSNDRFANIESSLLLQCIEEYQGVTLLATNNMTAIDAAFVRRFRFFLQFKEPDEEIRYEIWKSTFPKEAPVSPEVDFRELARIFRFTGAIIKNVALQAAYLSAGTGREIGMIEIMVAVRREMEKNHRMLTRDDMGPYGYLFPEMIAWSDRC